MRIFDLFSRKKKKSQVDSNQNIVPVVTLSVASKVSDESSKDDAYSKMFKLESREISITEVNKEINNLYKENGFLTAKSLFQNFWDKNKDTFQLIDAHRLISNYVNILKKEKISSDELCSFIDSQMSIYPESSNYNYVLHKAKMLKKFDLKKSLEYLKAQNDIEVTNNSDKETFVEAIYLQSEYLLINKNYEEAFINLSRASLVLPHFDQFNYLRWSTKISSLSAQICFKENKPKYDSYLFFEISSFLLEVLVQISSFPHCYNFYRWKKEYKESSWPYGDDKDFDKALNALNMLESKSEILIELKDFAYNQLPDIYGIPREYNTHEKIKEVTDRDSSDYQGWYKLSQISEKLQAKFADKEVTAIHAFVQNLTKKYYDKNNQT